VNAKIAEGRREEKGKTEERVNSRGKTEGKILDKGYKERIRNKEY
jgi:hypothetical protein